MPNRNGYPVLRNRFFGVCTDISVCIVRISAADAARFQELCSPEHEIVVTGDNAL